MGRKKVFTPDTYDEETQIVIEVICAKLSSIETLLCDVKKTPIDSTDIIYLDRKGIVKEGAHDRVKSLLLGSLDELREWCKTRRKGVISLGPPIPSTTSSIGPVSKEVFSVIAKKFRRYEFGPYPPSSLLRLIPRLPYPMFIVKSAVRAYGKRHGMQISSDAFESLNYRAGQILDKAFPRMLLNKRKTLKEYDF